MTYPPGSDSSSTPPEQEPTYSPPPTPAYPPVPPAYSPAPEAPPAPAYSAAPAFPTAPTSQLPPVPAQPMPAAPTYDPAAMAAAQYSGPPVSGPYGYAPMGAPPAPPKKGVATVVLAVLLTIFVLASGAFGTLFVLKNREASDLSGKITQLNGTVASTQQELDTTKRNLEDSDDELKTVTSERKAMADCLNGIYAFWDALDAAGGTTNPATDAAADEADRLCELADKYLAPR